MARRHAGVPGGGTTGPLAPFVDDYRVKLTVRGYSERSVECALRHVARLSRWLEERGLGAADLGGERLEEFLGELPRRRDGGRVCSRRALSQVLEVLAERGLERPRVEPAAVWPSEVLLGCFERFLLQERAVAPSTASVYVARARRFLDWCAPDAELAGLTASDVTGAVLSASASNLIHSRPVSYIHRGDRSVSLELARQGRTRGSRCSSAARNTRSGAVNRGRSICRCRTASWWRSAKISTSFSALLIGNSLITVNTLETAR